MFNVSGGMSGAAAGGQVGSMFGPQGAMIGAGLGGLYGLFSGGDEETQSGVDANKMAAMSDPAGQFRGQWADRLNQLVMDPSSVTQTPGYQFQMEQGTEAINRGMAASGQLQSGGEQLALQKFGQGLASDSWLRQIQMMSGLVGGSPGGGAQSYMSALQNRQEMQKRKQGEMMGGLGGLSKLFGGMGTSSGGQPTSGVFDPNFQPYGTSEGE